MAAEACYQVWWDDDACVARTTWTPGAVCGADEAHGITTSIEALGHGSVPLLVDMRGMAKMQRDGREHFTSDQGGVRAVALLVGSPVNKMIANFFIGTHRMPIPIRMFTDDAVALEWLADGP